MLLYSIKPLRENTLILIFCYFLFLSVAQCGEEKINLKDKNSSQSSYYTDIIHYISNRAYDGNTSTCSHTLQLNNSWWRIDLQGVYSISSISIYNIDALNADISGAQIYIGYSLQNNGTNNNL